MGVNMLQTQISLSEEELGIILSLLKQERDELPVEVHHTSSAKYRGELHVRQTLVNTLIGRLEKSPTPQVA